METMDHIWRRETERSGLKCINLTLAGVFSILLNTYLAYYGHYHCVIMPGIIAQQWCKTEM